eukprot:5918202-Karenia_brevis.AAC.1
MSSVHVGVDEFGRHEGQGQLLESFTWYLLAPDKGSWTPSRRGQTREGQNHFQGRWVLLHKGFSLWRRPCSFG